VWRRRLLTGALAVAVAGPVVLQAARPALAAPDHRLFVVADSVGLSAKDAIPPAFAGWDVTVTGRPAVFSDVAVSDYIAPQGSIGDIAVVATGYNYPFWDPARFDRAIDASVDTLVAKGVRHVIWVTLREVKPQYISASAWQQIQPYYWYFPEVNQHLHAALARHPELVLADWAAIADRPGITYDAIHLNTTGATLYAQLLRSEVDGLTRQRGGTTLVVPVAGGHGVPAGAPAVVLNVTVADPKYAGYATVYPCGEPTPTASTVNYTWAQTVSNHVLAKPGAGGGVCVFTSADAHLIVDLAGWFPPGDGELTTISPRRLSDTRASAQRLAPGGQLRIPATGVPAGASVALNVTAVDPAGPGYLSVYPCGSPSTGSNVNYDGGQTVANLATTPLGPDGSVCVTSFAAADVVVDLMGWFDATAAFTAVAPHRILDTRAGPGPAAGGTALTVDLAGAGVSTGARAAAVTVILTDTAADGYATVFPCGGAPPLASDLDYTTGSAVPAFTLAPSNGGRFCVFTSATADIVVDLAGWLGSASEVVSVAPVRLVDTRDTQNAPGFR
jgi:hypothetical protein